MCTPSDNYKTKKVAVYFMLWGSAIPPMHELSLSLQQGAFTACHTILTKRKKVTDGNGNSSRVLLASARRLEHTHGGKHREQS